MLNTLTDLRFAVRMLARRPGFTALALITLALGIGATTAIFSAVYPIIMEPLPYPNADRIVMVYERERKDGSASRVGFATFEDIERDSKSFASMAVMSEASATISGGEQPERFMSNRVSSSVFRRARRARRVRSRAAR